MHARAGSCWHVGGRPAHQLVSSDQDPDEPVRDLVVHQANQGQAALGTPGISFFLYHATHIPVLLVRIRWRSERKHRHNPPEVTLGIRRYRHRDVAVFLGSPKEHHRQTQPSVYVQ